MNAKTFLIGALALPLISIISTADAEEIVERDRAFYARNTKAYVFTNQLGGTMLYRLFVPRSDDPKKPYPLLLSFHGAGSRGNDNLTHLRSWVAGWVAEEVQNSHPCFILMPQCPLGQQWVNTPWVKGSYSYSSTPISAPMTLAKEILDKVVQENPVDTNRIFVMGPSMGGYGTWDFVMRYPELVAAAVPMCGAGDPTMAETIKSIPIWAFHGDKDDVVPTSGSQDMIHAIKQTGGGKAKLTIYPGVKHDCYIPATKDPALVDWVFSQKRMIKMPDLGTSSTGALFTENFNREARLMGNNRQFQSFLPVKHAHELPGWTKQGADLPAHFVEQYADNWAFMLVASKSDENVFTQREGFKANDKGHVYTVSFDAGAGVYAMPSQATAAGDKCAVELLRPNGTVLKKHLVTPGKWSGKLVLENHTFTYDGDGAGPLRFRISPVYTSGVRFFGVVDHLQVFASPAGAKAAFAQRQAVEKSGREEMSKAMEKLKKEGLYATPTPRFTFSETLPEQLAELKTNELMLRFAASRKNLAADSYRPAYHYVNAESSMNDPNSLVFWQGLWHLFFIAMPPDEFPNPADILQRWQRTSIGHAVSDDLVHWRDLPYAIHPGIERACYSGGMLAEKDRVISFYPGMGAGQMVAISDDPLLLNWEKQGPVNTRLGDSCIWKEGDTYYGLTGNKIDYIPGAWWPQMEVWSTKDLVTWQALGNFIEDYKTPFTSRKDDGACPDFKPIGDKYILTFFSHFNGGQYFLGDYDQTSHRFKPYEHGRFNHGTVAPGGVHAPSVVPDGQGGLFNILNINHAKDSDDWDQVMSLPQQLTLGPDKRLRIEPVAAVASLRGDHQHLGRTVIPANEEIILETIRGNTMELAVELDPKEARWVQLNVLRSPNAEEQTSITFFNHDRQLTYWYQTAGEVVLDGSRSSTLPDVWLRPPERAIMRRGGELLRLRVFMDRSVVEVFVNERQYLAMRIYPGRKDSLGVSLRAQGQEAVLQSLDAWQMRPIWP